MSRLGHVYISLLVPLVGDLILFLPCFTKSPIMTNSAQQQYQEKIETENTERNTPYNDSESIKYNNAETATSLSDPEKDNSNKVQSPFVKSPEESKLVRKIRFTLMPFIIFLCMLQVANTLLHRVS